MAWSNIGGGGENVKPEVQTQTPLIEDIKESLVGKATGANATEDTILEGYSAYVGQELIVGKYNPNAIVESLGYSKIDIGSFTPLTTTEMDGVTIPHSLGIKPNLVLIFPDTIYKYSSKPSGAPIQIIALSSGILWYGYAGSVESGGGGDSVYDTARSVLTSSRFKCKIYPNNRFVSGETYRWIALA